MTFVSTPTLLSIDQYAEIMGIPPIHFAQGVSLVYPDDGGCRDVWYQDSWMAPGKASREELAMAISQAEVMIAQLVGFWPAPKWIEDIERVYPRQRMHMDGVGIIYYPDMSQGRWKTMETTWGYVIEGGRRRVDLIASGIHVVLPSDIDHGMVTLTVPWTGATAEQVNEVAVFAGTDTRPNLQIRGLTVQITGGIITVQGRPASFIDPTLWSTANLLDGDDPATYLGHVNLYRVYNSSAGSTYAPVKFLWQEATLAQPYVNYGILQLWNGRIGIVSPIPATWDATTATWTPATFATGDEPHRAQMYYRAGWPLDSYGRVAAPFARAIASLATSLLGEPVCGCSQALRLSGLWQSSPDAHEQTPYRQLDCPWGTKKGAYEAYRLLSTFWGGAGGISL